MTLPVALHVPDGFLSGGVSAVLWALAIGAIAYSLHRAEDELTEDKVPMLGVLAAFIFAVQMLNFPVAGGTSGHLLGATLAAVLLGAVARLPGDDRCAHRPVLRLRRRRGHRARRQHHRRWACSGRSSPGW